MTGCALPGKDSLSLHNIVPYLVTCQPARGKPASMQTTLTRLHATNFVVIAETTRGHGLTGASAPQCSATCLLETHLSSTSSQMSNHVWGGYLCPPALEQFLGFGLLKWTQGHSAENRAHSRPHVALEPPQKCMLMSAKSCNVRHTSRNRTRHLDSVPVAALNYLRHQPICVRR